ncbi:MAG: cell division protein FtsQ/DivIB [Rhodobacterales bacterium]|nr:cell division protein FtsQ/DivIB [Rhodobacterales bacterium]
MREVKTRKPESAKRRADPSPSRWSYRVQRILLTPIYRRLLRFGLPFGLALMAGTIYLSDEERLARINASVAELRQEIENRPEFMVQVMAIEGASDEVARTLRASIDLTLPRSTFNMDLAEIRNRVLALPAIADASVRVQSGGVLQIDVVERVAVLLWRTADEVVMLDKDGVVIGAVMQRQARPELAMIAGDGADKAVSEAQAILRAARPIEARLRGLVRMGARRWDVVLDRGQKIMLPEDNPVRALERVIALSQAEDMLDRDLVVVDVRFERRPTLRMNVTAVEQWWRIREMTVGDGN